MEGRLPDGWELHICDQMGLMLSTFNHTVFHVELGIDDKLKQPLNLM